MTCMHTHTHNHTHTSVHTYIPTYLPTTHPPMYLPTYLPTHPPTYLPAYLPTHPPTNLPTYAPKSMFVICIYVCMYILVWLRNTWLPILHETSTKFQEAITCAILIEKYIANSKSFERCCWRLRNYKDYPRMNKTTFFRYLIKYPQFC